VSLLTRSIDSVESHFFTFFDFSIGRTEHEIVPDRKITLTKFHPIENHEKWLARECSKIGQNSHFCLERYVIAVSHAVPNLELPFFVPFFTFFSPYSLHFAFQFFDV
jgi:hypothetical protein